ncbi:MAG: site-specific integrase [Burkholderiales bacterium]|nr:site-specific integrase [Burkholderiales bacterium]
MEILATTPFSTGAIAKQAVTSDLLVRFVNYLDASPKTVQSYTKSIKQFFSWLAGKHLSQPTRQDVLAFRDEIKTDHKPATVQAYITAVRLFFQWTALEGLYPNIAEHVKSVKIDRGHKKDYLTSHQVKNVLELVDTDNEEGLRNYAILVLMFTGGLRTIEVVRADIGDIRTVGDNTVLFIQGKGQTEKGSFINLQPGVEDAIRAYLKCRPKAKDQDPLFSSTSNRNKGGRLTTRTIRGMVKAAFMKANLCSDHLSAHSTRHTAVTLSLLAGISLQEVQQFARHKNISTTLIYSHNLDRAKNPCEATIAKAILG